MTEKTLKERTTVRTVGKSGKVYSEDKDVPIGKIISDFSNFDNFRKGH